MKCRTFLSLSIKTVLFLLLVVEGVESNPGPRVHRILLTTFVVVDVDEDAEIVVIPEDKGHQGGVAHDITITLRIIRTPRVVKRVDLTYAGRRGCKKDLVKHVKCQILKRL